MERMLLPHQKPQFLFSLKIKMHPPSQPSQGPPPHTVKRDIPATEFSQPSAPRPPHSYEPPSRTELALALVFLRVLFCWFSGLHSSLPCF